PAAHGLAGGVAGGAVAGRVLPDRPLLLLPRKRNAGRRPDAGCAVAPAGQAQLPAVGGRGAGGIDVGPLETGDWRRADGHSGRGAEPVA
ncbi:hypothetical protein QP65_00155, partial [Staphylococcus aureus]